jgi:hypothetical protein
MPEIAAIAVIVVYSVWRTWRNALYPFVFITFFSIVQFWAKVRVEVLFTYKSVLDYFTVALFLLALARHGARFFRLQVRYSTFELALVVLVLYSWFTMSWHTGVYWDSNPGTQSKTAVYQLLMLLIIPLLFKLYCSRDSFELDFLLVGLLIVPMIAMTTQWGRQGQEFLFVLTNADDGNAIQALSNTLQLSYFAAIMILFSVFHLRAKPLNILSFAVAVPSSLYLMVEAQTRGQLLALLICLIVFLPFVSRHVRLKQFLRMAPVPLLLLAVIAPNFGELTIAGLQMFGFEDYYARRYDPDVMAQDYGHRTRRAADAIGAWQATWMGMLFGLGTTSSTSPAVAGDYIHIILLEVLIEQGILGALLFGYFLFGVLLSVGRMLNIPEIGASERRAAAFLAATFLLTFIISFKQGSFYTSPAFLMNALLVIIFSQHLEAKYRVQSLHSLRALRQRIPVQA